ncbi:hypothetical protein MNBD_PLANCTO03-758 [hydrothermal vent metagenome]|uniref:ABC-type transport system involved in multi-copper enzyme maturation, permease component n=1 Tax=hydrothermal vent metagenome TaxID=652676 RepID=A0A3B1D2M9_9ZZZZ
MMTQTVALFVDAYRELNAKKLFWITMLLSGLVVAIYAMIGINEEGITFLWFTLDFLPGNINSEQIPPEILYKGLFMNLGIGIWLTWIATILALISTAGIIPDMIAGGSIEMLLSKPISRTRLFLTKYTTGLLFAGLQVAAFTTASFLVIGIRGGVWEPGLFLAIPLVVCFFSYLYAVCALIGVLTRSTIAALLITLLFWCGLFIINMGDAILLSFKVQFEVQRDGYTVGIDRAREGATKIITARREKEGDPVPEGFIATDEEMQAVMPWMASTIEYRDETIETIGKLEPWVKGVYAAKTLVPKTGETIALLERSLISMADLKAITEVDSDGTTIDEESGRVDLDDNEIQLRTQEAFRERSVWWVLGTSLAFEFLVLGGAVFVFARRDN